MNHGNPIPLFAPLGCCLGLFLLLGCDATEMESSREPTTEQVAEEPLRFLDKQVTLVGEVEEVEDTHAFQLEGNRELFGHELLVLTASPVLFGGKKLEEGERVVVSGTVRRFVVQELERDLDWDMSPELEVEWQTKAALVADSVTRIDETARWNERSEPDGVRVGLWTIYTAEEPDELAGDRVSFAGVQVQSVTGGSAWIGHNHRSQILLAPAQGTKLPELMPGDWVDVRGVLREMPDPDEAREQFGFPAEPSEHLNRQLDEEGLYIEALSVTMNESARARARAKGTDKVAFDNVAKEPQQHVGDTVEGEAAVSDVLSNRAFWLEGSDPSHRLLGVVVNDTKEPSAADKLKVGQKIRFSALAMAPKDMDTQDLQLKPDSKKTLLSQSVVLTMDAKDLLLIDDSAAVEKLRKIAAPQSTERSRVVEPGDRVRPMPYDSPPR